MLNLIISFFFIYFIFRLLVSYIMPLLMRRYVRRRKRDFYEQNPNYGNYRQNSQNKVNINYPNRDKHFDISDIEYTDFEEIKEDK